MSALARTLCAVVIFLLCATTAHAQTVICPVTPDPATSNQVCANTAFVHKAINATPPATTPPGGISGQLQYNNSGAFGGFTASGDATINTSTGVVTLSTDLPTTDFFVATTGSDSNDCESATVSGGHGPCLTLQHAIEVITRFHVGGISVTLHIGAGSFVGFCYQGQLTASAGLSLGSLTISGAGSTSTTITTSSCEGNIDVQSTVIAITGVKFAISTDGVGVYDGFSSSVFLNGDVTFSGADNTTRAITGDANSLLFVAGNITVAGTIETFYWAHESATFRNELGTITITGTLSTMFDLDGGSTVIDEGCAIASCDPSVALNIVLSGGTLNGQAYTVASASSINVGKTFSNIWTGSSGQPGELLSGGRTTGATATPTIASSTGLGTGSAAVSSASAYGAKITLSPTGSPSATGTVVLQINEYLNLPAGGGFFAYVVSAADGTGTWQNGVTTKVSVASSGTGTQVTIRWTNVATNLTAGSTYNINVVGQN